ncbi:MAG: dethiobiotin synthase [Deltaproteobacteria bacterium]|nr:dethiobiotin synthase [Deltaproteobacteria bacterium]
MNDLYVAGTDTGVGKTVLSLLLMQFLFEQGKRPFYLKPLQTGCKTPRDEDSDAAFIYRHVESLRDGDPGESVIYCFANPKAPFFAARDEGSAIDLKLMERIVAEKSRAYSPLVIEAAGGVLVPVAEGTLIVDIMQTTGAKVLIAARAGLGTINHTLLSIEALQARGIKPAAIIFIDAAETPPEMIAENREAIEACSGIKVAGVIGRIADFSHPPRDSYRPIEFLFREGLV